MSSLLKSAKGKEILKRVTLKKVKTGFGHDLCGAFADFYLDNKKMGYFNDDGCGGEVDIVFVSDTHQKKFESFLTDGGVAQIMFDNDWKFLKSASEISLDEQVTEFVNTLLNLKEEEKLEKKMMKACEKGIHYKTANDAGYKGITFKIPLKEIVIKHSDGKKLIQEHYDKMKADLKDGEFIINENLEELGIKL